MPVNSQKNSLAATGRLTCGVKRGNTALYVKHDVNVFMTVAHHPDKSGDITPIAANKKNGSPAFTISEISNCKSQICFLNKQTQFKKEQKCPNRFH